MATLADVVLPAGPNDITASYPGDSGGTCAPSQSDSTLVAVAPAAGGIFYSDPASGGDGTVYVFGGQDSSWVAMTAGRIQASFDLSSEDPSAETYDIPTDATAIEVYNEVGTNSIAADASVTLPLTVYGGSGSDRLTDLGSGPAQFVAGSGTETFLHIGSGSDSMTPGTGTDILSEGDLGDYLTVSGARSGDEGDVYTLTPNNLDPSGDNIASWSVDSVDWGDGTVNSNLSHTYTFGNSPQAYTVTVSVTGEDTLTSAQTTATYTLTEPPVPELLADGPPTLNAGQACVLSLSAAPNDSIISDWNINWDDGTVAIIRTSRRPRAPRPPTPTPRAAGCLA